MIRAQSYEDADIQHRPGRKKRKRLKRSYVRRPAPGPKSHRCRDLAQVMEYRPDGRAVLQCPECAEIWTVTESAPQE